MTKPLPAVARLVFSRAMMYRLHGELRALIVADTGDELDPGVPCERALDAPVLTVDADDAAALSEVSVALLERIQAERSVAVLAAIAAEAGMPMTPAERAVVVQEITFAEAESAVPKARVGRRSYSPSAAPEPSAMAFRVRL